MPSAQGHITVRRRAKNGTPGSDAVRYWVVPSVTQIKKAQNGTLYPNVVTCEKRKQSGDSAPVATSEGSLYYQIGYVTGSSSSRTTYSSSGVSVTNSIAWIKFMLDINNLEVAAETVSVVADGDTGNGIESVITYYKFNTGNEPNESDSDWKTMEDRKASGMITEPNDTYPYMWKKIVTKWTNGTSSYVIEIVTIKSKEGKQGIQGCIYRRSRHAIGFEYHNDSALTTTELRYIDLAYLMTNNSIFASKAKWFRCKKTHTSNSSNAPQLTSNGTEAWLEYWEPLNNLEPIYTPFLMADDAVITLMQSNQILIEDDKGTVTAGLSGSTSGKKIRIWAGSATPDNAPFRVDVNGALVATKADITGTINAEIGKIAGFNISGNSLTNGPDFNNDACIIFRNDTQNTFAGIGGNVLPAVTGLKAVARFENHDEGDCWGLGTNYAMLLSARGSIENVALHIDGGTISGLALHTIIVGTNETSKTLGRHDTNIVAINKNECILTLPTMQLYDDGHVIRIKRLGEGGLKIKLGYCYTYNGLTSTRYTRPCLIYDQKMTLTGTNTLSFDSVCDAMDLVWCRDIIQTIGNTTYYGCWLQYKLPRDW